MTREFKLKLWNDYYRSGYFTRFIEFLNKNYFVPLFIKEFNNIVKADNLDILECGCGQGYMSSLLAKSNNVTALDISDEALKITKFNFVNNYTDGNLVKGDIFNMPFKDNSFNVVWNQGVLEHFNPINAIREMLRVTKDHLIVFLPAFLSPLQISGAYKFIDNDIEFYKSKKFIECMEKANCKNIKIKKLWKSFMFTNLYIARKGCD